MIFINLSLQLMSIFKKKYLIDCHSTDWLNRLSNITSPTHIKGQIISGWLRSICTVGKYHCVLDIIKLIKIITLLTTCHITHINFEFTRTDGLQRKNFDLFDRCRWSHSKWICGMVTTTSCSVVYRCCSFLPSTKTTQLHPS